MNDPTSLRTETRAAAASQRDWATVQQTLWPELEQAFVTLHRTRQRQRVIRRTLCVTAAAASVALALWFPWNREQGRQQAQRPQPSGTTRVPAEAIAAKPDLANPGPAIPAAAELTSAGSGKPSGPAPLPGTAPGKVQILTDEELVAYLASTGKPWIPVEIDGKLRVYLGDHPDPKARLN